MRKPGTPPTQEDKHAIEDRSDRSARSRPGGPGGRETRLRGAPDRGAHEERRRRGRRRERRRLVEGDPLRGAPRGRAALARPPAGHAVDGRARGHEYAHDCMQLPFPSDAAPLGTPPSEDCLYVNVWAPEKPASAKLPVMFWIHGGGFVNGGSSRRPCTTAAPSPGAASCFVSLNHRLGRFGFFAHPALTRESGNEPAGQLRVPRPDRGAALGEGQRRGLRRRPRERDDLRRVGRRRLGEHPRRLAARARALPQGDRAVRRRSRRRPHGAPDPERGRGGGRRVREARGCRGRRRGGPRRAPEAPRRRPRPGHEPHDHGPAARHLRRADDRRKDRHGGAGDSLPRRPAGEGPVPGRGQQPRVRLHAAAAGGGGRHAGPLRRRQGRGRRRLRSREDGQHGRGRGRRDERRRDGGAGAAPRPARLRRRPADLCLPLLLRRLLDPQGHWRARCTRPRSRSSSRPCARSTATATTPEDEATRRRRERLLGRVRADRATRTARGGRSGRRTPRRTT